MRQHTPLFAAATLLLSHSLAMPVAARDEQVPTESFSRYQEFHSVRLSPSGKYIAVSVPRGDTTGLVILDTETLQLVSAGQLDEDMHVLRPTWVSDNTLVSGVGYQEYWSQAPINRGELVSFSAQGGDLRYLMGFKGRHDSGKVPGTIFNGWSFLDNRLEFDADNVLVSSCAWTSGELCHWSLYRLNIDSGRRQRVIRAPQLGTGDFVTDRGGDVRYFVGETDNLVGINLYEFDAENRTWGKVEFDSIGNAVPVSYDPDNDHLYLSAIGASGMRCLYRTVSTLDSVEEIACHDTVDLHSFDLNSEGTRPIRAYFQNGLFESVNVAPDLEEARLLEAISNRFEGNLVQIASWSDDGNLFVFHVSSDRNPGEYYLFDRAAKRARYLFATRSWIDPKQMAERRPIHYEARDGTLIRGYLTVPPQGDAPWPMVVLPHGGPFGIQDGWRWDPDAQFLAGRGYAVLQVNFRGSGGYGADFHDAGIHQWGTGMINDITDGTRWAIESGVAHANNICVFGVSFGGYSSMMSAVREPELYQCVVAYAGVYDLRTLNRKSDTGQFSRGRNFIDDYIGDSNEDLLEHSPITYIDKLKAPVMIVHGINDERTPYKDAKTLRSALKQRDIPYEWFVRDREGHGFRKPENRLEFYDALDDFLSKHLTPAEGS